MFFIRPVGPSGLDHLPPCSRLRRFPVTFLMFGPMMWQTQPTAESWAAIYRLAYEQLVIAFGPSKFQRAPRTVAELIASAERLLRGSESEAKSGRF